MEFCNQYLGNPTPPIEETPGFVEVKDYLFRYRTMPSREAFFWRRRIIEAYGQKHFVALQRMVRELEATQ